MQLIVRAAMQQDVEVLWKFLAIAAHEPSAAAAKAIPVVALHVLGWIRPGDFGVIALNDGEPVGAAWARQFRPDENPAFYVDDRTPEIAIAVLPEMRGQRIGEALLRAVCTEAANRFVDLCLNVREGNPAVDLYQRMGFERIPGSEISNRTGGLSLGMVWARTASR